MEDEILTPEADETPEETPDPIAEKEAALAAKEAELAAKEKSLQKGFNEIAAREKAVASKTLPADPESPMDPELKAQLDPYIKAAVQEQYGGTLEAAQSAFAVSVQ